MIRSFKELENAGLRKVLNHAYYEMIGLCIMYKDYDYSDAAAKYAKKTVIYSRYDKHRINGTDLYNIFAYLTNIKESKLSKNDLILMKRATLDISFYERYLRRMMNGSLSVTELDMFMRKITKELYIEDNILKSLGRMAINWNRLSLRERKLTLDKMMRYGTVKFRLSDVNPKIREFNNEFEIDDGKYQQSLGKEPKDSKPEKKPMSKTEMAIYAIGGYALYKFLQKKKEKHDAIKNLYK